MKLPFEKNTLKKIEKVKRTATRWIPSQRNLSYKKNTEETTTASPYRKKDRGDVIMVYKWVEGIEKIEVDEYVVFSQSVLS